MKKNLLFIAIFFVYSFNVNAQEKTKDTIKTSSKIKVYTPSSSTTKSSSNDNSYKWAVKTDIFGIISGEIPIIGEYRFAKKFSVEASAGVTYSYLSNEFSLSSSDDLHSSEESKAAMGTAFRGAFKFYPSSDYDAIEGWNFGIQLYSKTTNRDYVVNSSNSGLLDGKKDVKNKTGFALVIGKQVFQDSNVTFESFIGIGIATIKRDYYDIVYNNTTNLDEVQSFSTKESKPNLQIGLRIGFGN